MPAIELLEHGLALEVLLSPADRPAPGSLGYVFGRSELNVSSWVHKGLVDAGAMSNLDWANRHRVPETFRADLRIIHQTPEYPRALELVRADLRPEVENRLREVLLQAADDPEAREALRLFFGTSRFLPVDARLEQALDGLRAGVARVRAEVE